MKTKEGKKGVRYQVPGPSDPPEVEVSGAKRRGLGAVILTRDSWLLTPVLKNEGASGDVYENKGRRKKV